jgi:YacP-like NYN domain
VLLLDTYNILHVTGVLPPDLAGIEIMDLVRLIRASRYRHQPATLVCDGRANPQAKAGRQGLITIQFSGGSKDAGGRSADDLIAQIIAQSTAPRRLTVVSSDRAIIKAARRRRCVNLTSEAFLKNLVADAHHYDLAAGALLHGSQSQHETAHERGQESGETSSEASEVSTRSAAAGSGNSSGGITEAQIGRWIKLFQIDEAKVAADAARATDMRAVKAGQKPEAAGTSKAGASSPAPVGPSVIAPLPAEQRDSRHRSESVDVPAAVPQAMLPSDVLAEAEELAAHGLSDPQSRQAHISRRASGRSGKGRRKRA